MILARGPLGEDVAPGEYVHGPGGVVDWSELLGDLETQMLAEERLELEAEIADRAVRETALLGLADRLRAAAGSTVRLDVPGAGLVRGQLEAVGVDWLTLREKPGAGATLVPLGAVSAVRDLPAGAASLEGVVASRYTAQLVLRRIGSAGLPVGLTLRDGSVRRGRLGAIGKDYLELIEADGGRMLIGSAALAALRPV